MVFINQEIYLNLGYLSVVNEVELAIIIIEDAFVA